MVYEWKCKDCGKVVEVERKAQESHRPPTAPCPVCNQDLWVKLISKSSFQLKGGGWYKDGYQKTKNTPS